MIVSVSASPEFAITASPFLLPASPASTPVPAGEPRPCCFRNAAVGQGVLFWGGWKGEGEVRSGEVVVVKRAFGVALAVLLVVVLAGSAGCAWFRSPGVDRAGGTGDHLAAPAAGAGASGPPVIHGVRLDPPAAEAGGWYVVSGTVTFTADVTGADRVEFRLSPTGTEAPVVSAHVDEDGRDGWTFVWQVPPQDLTMHLTVVASNRAGSVETVLNLYHEERAQVPVVIYLAREGQLEPVLREVAGPEEQCPLAAVQALVAGPTAVEKQRGLGAVLPASTRVLGVKVAGNTAVVDLSREVVTRASEIGPGSTTEVLALNALYFTLVQFREVEKVRLLVEGKNKGDVGGRRIEDFWGHIGLPDPLAGSTSLLDVPARQEVGEPADGLSLASVRWSAHPGVFRLVFQVEGPGGEAAAVVPAAEATYSASSHVVHITINGVRKTTVAGLAPGQKVDLGDWRAETLSWDTVEDDQAYGFSLALRPERAYGWRLWSLPDPVRIVVDVFACGVSPHAK